MFKITNRDSPGNETQHYSGNIQHTEFSLESGLNALEHNIVKYMCRYKKKGTPLLDLEKVMWHLNTFEEYVEYYQPYKYVLANFMKRKVIYEGDLWTSFSRSQKLSNLESAILENALFWVLDEGFSIDKAKIALKRLMEDYETTTERSETIS